MVLPVVPFGVNTGQWDIRLDLNMNPSTQFLILSDLAAHLTQHNITKLMILNSHGGNDFKQIIRELGLKFPALFVCTCNYYQCVKELDFFEQGGEHAGEMETSLMLHLRPDLVRPLEEAGNGYAKKFRIAAFNEKWAWAERSWSQVTADTGIGNPEKATAEKGKACFEVIVSKVGKFVVDLCRSDRNDLYE
jgi:creatinine amidohydrolase